MRQKLKHKQFLQQMVYQKTLPSTDRAQRWAMHRPQEAAWEREPAWPSFPHQHLPLCLPAHPDTFILATVFSARSKLSLSATSRQALEPQLLRICMERSHRAMASQESAFGVLLFLLFIVVITVIVPQQGGWKVSFFLMLFSDLSLLLSWGFPPHYPNLHSSPNGGFGGGNIFIKIFFITARWFGLFNMIISLPRKGRKVRSDAIYIQKVKTKLEYLCPSFWVAIKPAIK